MNTKYQSLIIILFGMLLLFLSFGLRSNQNDVKIEAIKNGLHQKKVTVNSQYQSKEQIIWSK